MSSGSSSDGTGSSAGSSSSGGQSSSASGFSEEYFIHRTVVNRQQMRYFAAGICGLMAVFILTHWLHALFGKTNPTSSSSIRTTSRQARNLLIRKAPGFPSIGHVLLIAAYAAINAAVTFTNVDISVAGIANRCGWMLVVNFVLVVFLALKNTPLAILSAYSYERLNGLHQIAGYTTFIYLVLHASMYTDTFLLLGMRAYLQKPSITAGIVAAFGFLGVIFSGAIVRLVWYEIFFVTHVLCFLMALIGASYHQPDLARNGLLIMLILIAVMWGTDRLVRGSRMLFRSFNNHATLEPLPDGGTKIIIAKKPMGAVAGKHCFVWIPAIRKFESHPFTIAGTEPMEFVVNARDGFTRDLHEYAAAKPGAKLTASVDGPYGTFPDPMTFDKVVLIAGGSGATFTFGLAVNMLERMDAASTESIVFIWIVKKHENLSWFADHLKTLSAHPRSPKVNVSLYVTSASSKAATAVNSDTEEERRELADTANDGEERHKHLGLVPTSTRNSGSRSGSGEEDPEKAAAANAANAAAVPPPAAPRRSAPSTYSLGSFHGHELRPGRPDAAALIREAVSSTPASGRVLVAACGPSALMTTVRDTTAGLIRWDGPGVELHCEQFGW